MSSFCFAQLPSDVWLSLILPRLDTRDVTRLLTLSSESRTFFSTGRFRHLLRGLGFSEYITASSWLEFLRALGAHLGSLDMTSHLYAGWMPANWSMLPCVKNQTRKTVTDSLEYLAAHPRNTVKQLTFFTPFLDGIGGNDCMVETYTQFASGSNLSVPFDTCKPWNRLLWPTLTQLRFVGLGITSGPLFSSESIRQLGAAVPNLEFLELQSVPLELNVASSFPKLETLIFSGRSHKGRKLTGSPALKRAELLFCTADSVASLVTTSPNLTVLNTGRKIVGVGQMTGKLALPASLRRLVTSAEMAQKLELAPSADGMPQLEWLEVHNCTEATGKAVVELLKCSSQGAVHRVPLELANLDFGNHVQVYRVSGQGVAPAGFQAVKYAWNMDNNPGGKNHTRVSCATPKADGGVCDACGLGVHSTMMDDHRLVCLRREQVCLACGARFATLAERDRHKRESCTENVSPCLECGVLVNNCKMTEHFVTEHELRGSVIDVRDCANQQYGCQFVCHEQDSGERIRHLARCRSAPHNCPSCREEIVCRAAPHECKGPKRVLCMLMGQRLRPESADAPLTAYPNVDGSWKCDHCEVENIVTRESSYVERLQCRACLKVAKWRYSPTEKQK